MGLLRGKMKDREGGEGSFLSDFFGFSRSLVRKEVIKPYMNPIDSHLLHTRVTPKIIDEVVKYAKTKGKEVNTQKLERFLSKHLLSDIFGLYYNERLELEKKRDTNKVKYKIVENINDYLSKIITNNSAISSYVFTEEIGTYLGKVFTTELTEQQQDQLNQELDNTNGGEEGEEGEGQGEGEGPGKHSNDKRPTGSGGSGSSKGPATEKIIEHGLEKTKQEFEKHLKKAQDKLKDLSNNTDLIDNPKNKDTVNHQMIEDVKNATDNMPKIKSEVEMLSVNKRQLEKAVEKILDKSTGHFSSKYKSIDEDLLNSEDGMDIDGLEFIHPIFQRTLIPELTTSERLYYGKFDLYIDHSGSMSSSCRLNTSHGAVSRTLLAKAIALRMKRMGILNDLYLFDSDITQLKNTELNIMLIGSGGGTHIERVLEHVRKTGRNSVVLTDGDDYINTYLHNAYFVGVSVGTFHNFVSEGGKKYLEYKQCCIFDGNQVMLPSEKDWQGR
jgi:hypothetical protein